MSVTSEATTTWSGGLFEGGGSVALESSNQGPFAVNWKARSEGSTSVTTPEELLAAAAAFMAAFLNAVFGLCLGCQLYLVLQRFGLVGRKTAVTA